MAEIILNAETGRTLGGRPSGRLRAEGKVPAVVYGLDKEPVPITVQWRELRATLVGEAGLNVLIDLHVGDDKDLVIVKDMQRHPVRREVVHVDFLRVSRDHEITVDIPVILEGEADAVHVEGGTVDQVMFTLSISAKPADIPNEVIIDISGLTIGDSIRVGDVALPAGVSTTLDPEDAVVATSAAMRNEEPESADDEGGDGGAEAAPSDAGE